MILQSSRYSRHPHSNRGILFLLIFLYLILVSRNHLIFPSIRT
nr:MAG TPA: hypothetical protein [Bacteriophage sp.]